MNSLTDAAELVSRCRSGDSVAIASLIHTYTPLVYRLAISILDDPAEADEAAQDTFVAVINKLDSFRGDSTFTTWMYAITLNVCRMRIRKRKTGERLIRMVQGLFGSGTDAVVHPEQTAIQNEVDQTLWAAVCKLDARQREVVILRYFYEMRLGEIAKVVGVSDRTVRTRLHEAHERMRSLLRGAMDSQ